MLNNDQRNAFFFQVSTLIMFSSNDVRMINATQKSISTALYVALNLQQQKKEKEKNKVNSETSRVYI